MNSELREMSGFICGCGLVLLFIYSFIRIAVKAFLKRNPRLFFVIFIAVPLLLGLTDYIIALKRGHPLLSFPTMGLLDGGSMMNVGWGYTILELHQLVIHPSHEDRFAGFKVGPKLTFWFLLGLESSKFKATEMEAPTKRSNTTPVPLSSTGEVER